MMAASSASNNASSIFLRAAHDKMLLVSGFEQRTFGRVTIPASIESGSLVCLSDSGPIGSVVFDFGGIRRSRDGR